MYQQHHLGKHGEARAVQYLRARGYRIMECNWRTRWGEIDIIAQRGDTVYFFEVKTRGSQRYGHPFAAVTPLKQKKLYWLGQAYITQQSMSSYQSLAVGVIGILPDRIECITNINE